MEPPTPGFTRASRESHWINSFTSVSAFQTAAGGAAISRSWIMERRFAFAVDAVALMVELLLRTISVSCKILRTHPGEKARLNGRICPSGSEDRLRYERPVQNRRLHSVVTTSLRNVSRDSCCQAPAPKKRNTYAARTVRKVFVLGGSPVPPPSAYRETFRAPGEIPAPFPADRWCSSRLRQLLPRAQRCCATPYEGSSFGIFLPNCSLGTVRNSMPIFSGKPKARLSLPRN